MMELKARVFEHKSSDSQVPKIVKKQFLNEDV